ncbi:MAG: cytochrome c1 [Stagnimonas sp.]|nr:cytochrome c1 [Stagnimonas sp.]
MKLTKVLASGLIALASLGVGGSAVASGGESHPYFAVDTANLAGLQRGARDFMAYCSGCHSLKYLRYNRMAADLGIPEASLKAKLMFASDKPSDVIVSAMPATAIDWLGAQPPDLSLTARSRGADWVADYLQSFYLDPSRPLGVNNTVLPGASMPHVLWELQGWQAKVEHHEGAAGEGHGAKPFELVQAGKLSPEEYKKFVGDLTNFLVYAAEPGREHRKAVGWKVLAFLSVFLVLAYMLKKEYWKDVH